MEVAWLAKGFLKTPQSKISFVAVVLLFSLFLATIPLRVSAKTYVIDEYLESGDYFEVHDQVVEGKTISGNFSFSPAYSYPVLRFFICNTENLQLWLDGLEFEKYYDWYFGVDTADEFEVVVPSNGTWYAVFSAPESDLLNPITLTGYVVFETETPPLAVGIPLVAGTVVISIIVIVAIYRRQGN